MGVAGYHQGVAVIDDRQLRERIDSEFHVPHLGTSIVARRADLSGAEARPGTVGHEIVHRRADDDDIGAL